MLYIDRELSYGWLAGGYCCMLCSVVPGGVVAGVAGIERAALLRLVSMDMGGFVP